MKKILSFMMLMVALAVVSSCSEESLDVDDINKQTTLVFMPWSGSQTSNGLYSYFQDNLDSIESAIVKKGSMSGRVLVFLSTSANESSLYEITCSAKTISHTTLKTYQGNSYVTSEGIKEVLADMQANAYALNYSMIIGGHGSGWTFKDDWENYPYKAKRYTSQSYPTTRFYGSVSSNDYATDIATLAQGIRDAGIVMQYIMFDDCYMANVETAYELKDVTNFVIGSTSEIMAIGMPYQSMWTSLASSTPAYSTAVTAFKNFYSAYEYPYGTLSVIDCRKMERLAAQMKTINSYYTLDDSLVDSLQVLDGFSTPIYYDMGDYVSHLCENTDMLNDFNSLLSQVVKSSTYTDSIYSYIYSSPSYIKVNTFSGLTISDPSRNGVVLKGREKTAWWKATHQQ